MSLLGLDATELGAIGTIALTLITAMYVYFTWRLSRHAAESVELARKSAEAMERATAISEASLEIDFDVEYHLEQHDERSYDQWLIVTGAGARVVVNSVSIFGAVFPAGKKNLVLLGGRLEVLNPRSLPTEVMRGQAVTFDWPTGILDLTQRNAAFVEISFSLHDADQRRKLPKTVPIPFTQAEVQVPPRHHPTQHHELD